MHELRDARARHQHDVFLAVFVNLAAGQQLVVFTMGTDRWSGNRDDPVDMIRLAPMPAGMTHRRSAPPGRYLDRHGLFHIGLELLLMLQAQLRDGLVPLQQRLFQLGDPLLVARFHGVKLLAQFEGFLVNLHYPGGGEGVQVRAVVTVGALKIVGCIHAAAHKSLRLTCEDQPVEVRKLVDQSFEFFVACGHLLDFFEVFLAYVAGAGDAVKLEGEIEAGAFWPLGGNRSDEDVEVVGDLLAEQLSLLLKFVDGFRHGTLIAGVLERLLIIRCSAGIARQ